MKVKEFITNEWDLDVYDNVYDEIGIAFCGPLELTKGGEKKFAEVLEYEIEPELKYHCAFLDIDYDDWKDRLKKAKEFFYSAAGYCDDGDYQKWFKED